MGHARDLASAAKSSGHAPIVVSAVSLGLALLGLAIWQGASGPGPTPSMVLAGRTDHLLPGFSLPTLGGPVQQISLRSFAGRPLVINFWASWCVPCRTEMPLLEAAFRRDRGKVAFLGVDVNDTTEAAQAFLKQMHVDYPVVSDSDGAVANRYGLYGLPTTVFGSNTARDLGRHLGELRAGSLRDALAESFGDRLGQPAGRSSG